MLLYNKFEGYCSEMLSPHNFNGIALTSFGIFVFTNGLFFYFCKQGLLEIMTSKVTKIYRYHNDSKRQEQNQELPFHSHPTHPTPLASVFSLGAPECRRVISPLFLGHNEGRVFDGPLPTAHRAGGLGGKTRWHVQCVPGLHNHWGTGRGLRNKCAPASRRNVQRRMH